VVFDAFQLEVILPKDGTSLRKVAWGLAKQREVPARGEGPQPG
jgi:hypothetical protein